MASSTGINDLPPEVFGVIADHIPLPARPYTLRSLAITNRHISQIIIPYFLYEHIIVHKEETLIPVIDLLCREDQTRVMVRGIYIRAFLSKSRHGQRGEYPVIAKLQELFSLVGLSGVHSINLRLGSYEKGSPEPPGLSNPFESLGEGFWTSLRKGCPNLRTLGIDHHCALHPTSKRWNLFPWNRQTSLSHFKVPSLHFLLEDSISSSFVRASPAFHWVSLHSPTMPLVRCCNTSLCFPLSLRSYTFGDYQAYMSTTLMSSHRS